MHGSQSAAHSCPVRWTDELLQLRGHFLGAVTAISSAPEFLHPPHCMRGQPDTYVLPVKEKYSPQAAALRSFWLLSPAGAEGAA